MIASHYLAAHEAGPDATDAAEVREHARTMLERAGHRSEGLGAAQEASRYYARAAELAEMRPSARRCSTRQARWPAVAATWPQPAGCSRRRSRCTRRPGTRTRQPGWSVVSGGSRRSPSAATRRSPRWCARGTVIAADEPDEDLALLAGWLALSYWYSGDLDRATEFAERALDIAETNAYPKALVVALRCRAGVAVSRGHRVVAGALLERALRSRSSTTRSTRRTRSTSGSPTCASSATTTQPHSRYLDEVLALSRRVGDRPREWGIVAERTYVLLMTGHWDEALGPGSRAHARPDRDRRTAAEHPPELGRDQREARRSPGGS